MTTTESSLRTTKPDSLNPSTTKVHISTGKTWTESEYVGWLPSKGDLEDYEFGTPKGPAEFVEIPYGQAGRSWATILIGKFVDPDGEDIGWAWQYYR